MTSLTCLSIGRLIDQRRSGLSSAERLRLEEHLVECEECSAHAAALDGLGGLVDAYPTSMDAQRRTALLDAALDQRAGERARPTRLHARAPWVAVAAVAAAASMLLTLRPADAPDTGEVAEVPPQADRVLQGRLHLSDGEVTVGAAVPAGRELSSMADAELSLGPARVELRAGSRMRWQRAKAAVDLSEGQLVAEVDPKANTRFRVRTPDFQVEVTGTRFWVTLGAVGVERGSVRVLSADGRVLSAHLTAGSHWKLPAPSAAKASEPVTAEDVEEPREAGQDEAPARSRADVGDLLLRARARIAPGRTAEARKLVARALASRPSRAQRAEGHTLLAECAMVEGDVAAAAKAYRQVAERFRSLPAGENALFAAARIHATREQRAQAVELLQRYRSRYPRGRFHREVASRLKALQSAQ